MNIATRMTQFTRSPGDPRVQQTGPSSLTPVDRLARALGWASIGLGLLELTAPRRVTRALGMEGQEGLVRAMGVREMGSGLAALSVDSRMGVWSRVAGDLFDMTALASAWRDDNRSKRNVGIAMAVVGGIALLDLACAQGLAARHGRGKSAPRDYSDRSGFPRSPEAMRGAARGRVRTTMRAEGEQRGPRAIPVEPASAERPAQLH